MKHTKLYSAVGLMALAMSFTFAQDATTGTTTDTGAVPTVTSETVTTTATTGTVTETAITGTTATGMMKELRNEIKEMKESIKDGYLKIRGDWLVFHEEFGYAQKYFIKPLTGDALSGAKALIKTKNEAVKALNLEIKNAVHDSGSIDWTGYIAKYVDIYTTFKTNAVPYINPTKLDAFNKFVDAKIATVQKNLTLRQKNITIKEQKYQKQQELKAAKEAKKAEAKAAKEKKMAELKAAKEAKAAEMKAKREANKKK